MNHKKQRLILGSLRLRVMFPAIVFVLIFSLFFIILNNYYISKLLDQRLEREAIRISKIASESRFILNPTYLNRLGKVIEGKIVVFDTAQKIVAASFDNAKIDDFLKIVNPFELDNKTIERPHGQIVKKIEKADRSYLLVFQKLSFYNTRQNFFLAILTPLDDLESARSNAILQTILSGGIALLMAFIAAGFILKKVSKTFSDILQVTKKIASGDFSSTVKPSDINELNMLAASINQMSDKLKAYEKQVVDITRLKSIDKITAAMAHEIKNPLASMKMLAQLIHQRIKNDKEGSLMAQAFIKEINRVDNLVSDLKSLSGTPTYNFSHHHPTDLLNDVICVIEPKLNHLNIKLDVQIGTGIQNIIMDKDKLKQVLWNLLMNAAESMPGGGEIKILLSCTTDGFIDYKIKDSGAGINSDDMEKIFMPFFTTKKEGIGIGLHICREIIQAHKGDINIVSTPKGTTAAVLLPVSKG